MSQEIARMATQSAKESGWCDRRDGREREENPYLTPVLRAAWLAGWQKANRQIF